MRNVDILLIEDSPSQALNFRLMLEQAGYQVAVAENGLDGWRVARAVQPHLILLDIDLPALDGFQVLSRLKRDRSTRHIPVVMLTHRDQVTSVEQALALGAADYLFKDDVAYELINVVTQVLTPDQHHHS